jgi:hypothetical protein
MRLCNIFRVMMASSPASDRSSNLICISFLGQFERANSRGPIREHFVDYQSTKLSFRSGSASCDTNMVHETESQHVGHPGRDTESTGSLEDDFEIVRHSYSLSRVLLRLLGAG